MGGAVAEPAEIWPRLCDSTIVYRAYRNWDQVDRVTGAPTPSCFLRRDPPKDEDGLSVGLTVESATVALSKPRGACSLRCGAVRHDDTLDVIQDRQEHAFIRGMPRPLEDRGEALRVAHFLMRISDVVVLDALA